MNNNLVEIAAVIDRSGSMDSVKSDAIGGFNTFLEGQKSVPGRANFTLVLFDDEYLVPYNGVDIQKVDPLNVTTYVPRGMTALLDAIGKTINTIGERLANTPEDQRPGKIIVAILTDGLENASQEFNRQQVFEMITHQRDTYNWEFIFLAAGQNAIAVGNSMGIVNNVNYVSSKEGTRQAYTVMDSAVRKLRTA